MLKEDLQDAQKEYGTTLSLDKTFGTVYKKKKKKNSLFATMFCIPSRLFETQQYFMSHEQRPPLHVTTVYRC